MVAVPSHTTSVGLVKSEEEEKFQHFRVFFFWVSGFLREEERSESLESARRLRGGGEVRGGGAEGT